jgi:hypothetical protein
VSPIDANDLKEDAGVNQAILSEIRLLVPYTQERPNTPSRPIYTDADAYPENRLKTKIQFMSIISIVKDIKDLIEIYSRTPEAKYLRIICPNQLRRSRPIIEYPLLLFKSIPSPFR